MFPFVGDHNSSVCEHHLGLDKIIDAQSVKTTEEAKTSEQHDA